jgi:hypothetical protein
MAQEQRIENRNDNEQRQDQQAERKPIWTITGTATAIQIFLITSFFLWLFIRDYVPNNSPTVFIESIFSLAIVIVVVVHAIMYYKQAQAMDAQLKVSSDALIVGHQAYVGICSIEDRTTPQGDVILITLENIGHVPADEISIDVHLNGLLLDRAMIPPDTRQQFGHVTSEHFGRTKLFPGKLKIEVVLPYDRYTRQSERMLIEAGRMVLYVWGKITYRDGFSKDKETEFSFYHRRDGRWMVAAPWSPDVIKMLEEQITYAPSQKDGQYQYPT